MLPLYLSIEGLYSYQNKQEIDFTALTEAGLFGIFGNVGSGKSSILEAISYALYGETERLNKQEKRAYNMLNLKSDQAIIDFQFLNFENRKFRFVVQWKRKKRFEETTSMDRFAYEWLDGQWIPLDSNDGALVTNLSYPNFRRTIIIPQGQFKEFLELKGKERSEMMKEIFFLNQYDLGPKVSFLQAENNRKLENIKGALTGFEEVSEVIKNDKEAELQAAQAQLINIKKEVEQLTLQFKDLAQAKEHRDDLTRKQDELARLNEKEPQIKLIEKELAEYESVSLHFREHINNLHQITASKEQLLTRIESLQEHKDELRRKIEANQSKITAIEPDYNNLDTYKRQQNEYQLLLTNVDLVQKNNDILARIEKGSPIVTKTIAEEQTLSIQLEMLESELENLKNNRLNTSELLEIEAWFLALDQHVQQINDSKLRLTQFTSDLQQITDQFTEYGLSTTDWQAHCLDETTKLEERQKIIQEKESTLLVKQELSRFIMNLHDGAPCPLCGSIEHPDIMHNADLTTEIDNIQALKKQWKADEAALNQLQNKLSTASQLLIEKKQQQQFTSEELAQKTAQYDLHQQQFRWTSFSKEDRKAFEIQKQLIKESEELIEKKELEIKSLRNNIQVAKDNVIKYQKSIDELKNQSSILEARITQNLDQVILLDHSLVLELTKMELTIHSNRMEETIKTTETNYKEWTTKLQTDKTEFATILGQFGEAQEQYKAYTQQLQNLQTSINSLLTQYQFEDITAVKTILNKNINTVTLKETVKAFYLSLHTLSQRINELLEITKDDTFTATIYEEISQELQLKSATLESQISITGSLEKELQRLIIELDKKVNLIHEMDKLSARKDNLRILDNMFKGNGFVNYVSSIHLERLCEIANTRFHRLTKNQLSLCINESNEFEVKDYLNNGYQRSIKTLSGGQSFQASLCLALALAENIQALNKADRNFFFIDEGFGTQDTDSINTVFDTLQYLHQENRIVGIISHVEELKERMPRSITVTKDNEKGSIIQVN